MKHEGPYDSSPFRADMEGDSKAVKSVKLKEKILISCVYETINEHEYETHVEDQNNEEGVIEEVRK